MVNTIKDKDSRGSDSTQEPHLLHLWRKCENPDRQRDRVKKQTLQASHRGTREQYIYPFTTVQTTKQWENRGIPQIPQSLHC